MGYAHAILRITLSCQPAEMTMEEIKKKKNKEKKGGGGGRGEACHQVRSCSLPAEVCWLGRLDGTVEV